jgi:hypothetical protein
LVFNAPNRCTIEVGWTGGVLGDSRALHFWDEKKKVGRFFADKDPETDDPDVV